MSVAAKIQAWARTRPHDLALSFLTDGENEGIRISFGELDDRARRVSGGLVRAGLSAKPVLLPASSGPQFVVAICGCLYSGAIAVPSPYLVRNRGERRIRAIAQDAEIAAIIECREARSEQLPEIIPKIPSISLTDLQTGPALLGRSDPHRPALVQYTSGSTSDPKGAVITHGNLSTNIAMLSKAFGVHVNSRVLTWLPLFHDMGLIGNVLAALYCGVPCIVMPPLSFLQRPLRWLKAIARYEITISGGPNFAYELCVRRGGREMHTAFNLSSWELAVCGGEPVRSSTMRDFAEKFARFGFRKTALYPSYGLAEATVFVSGGRLGDGVKVNPADAPAKVPVVSCGYAPRGAVEVVDPMTCELVPEGSEGEIWVSGQHVAAGYWNKPAETAATFAATLSTGRRKFLRTGDLGFKWQGEIYVTGRRKSLIIHRGNKLHLEDIEATIGSCHPDFGPLGAAFAIERNGGEELVVVYEVLKTLTATGLHTMIDQALEAVAREHAMRIFDLVLVRSGALPRTTSGKVQRGRCRTLYLSGYLPRIENSSPHYSLGVGQNTLRP